jgi:hypothetical protein
MVNNLNKTGKTEYEKDKNSVSNPELFFCI